MRTIALRHLAELNPPTPEFDALPADTQVAFLPLEAVWNDARADHGRTAVKSSVQQGYTRYRPGDVVSPKVTPTFQAGRSMIARSVGAGSTELHVLRPRREVDPRWLCYAARSKPFLDEGVTAFQGVAGLQRVPAEFVNSFKVADYTFDEQRRIADFLDDRVYRIDRIIAARREQVARVNEALARLSYDCVRGATVSGIVSNSGLDWLGPIPQDWPVLNAGNQFKVELGKMLDDKRQTGDHRLPYLRNMNVQWDHVSTEDLKAMDIEAAEYERYTVEPGDLLICEGGQPGRSAIWRGGIRPLGYQKALHRARPRGWSRPAWLLECLRVAVGLNVFTVASGQTTIGHLTNEQLRSQRFPFPKPEIQDRLLDELHHEREARHVVVRGLEESIELLTEYKTSLITAAVTGEFDVTTAGSKLPG